MDLAAAVTLGSTLQAQAAQSSPPSLVVTPTGCTAIDNAALDGGFRYGEITTIAGEPGTGKTLLTYHAIYGHLRAHPAAEVLIVDTNDGFEAARLRDVLAARMQAERDADAHDEPGINVQAIALLERVKFTRVVDVVGIAQAVQEVADGWAQRDQARAAERAVAADVIPSSQDDEMGEDAEGLGMASQPYEAPPDVGGGGTGLVVVDNIANHFSNEISKNAVQDQALLVSLLRSLQHLTRQRRICTILINKVVSAVRLRESNQQAGAQEDVSMFASVPGRPALGRTLAYLVDKSILLSHVAQFPEEAETAHAHPPALDSTSPPAAIVFEVLKDRNGIREGAWAAYDIVDDLRLLAIGPD